MEFKFIYAILKKKINPRKKEKTKREEMSTLLRKRKPDKYTPRN